MSQKMSVGEELLDVPFPEMVRSLAIAIADGQLALDLNSVNIAQELANTELDANTVIIAIEETVDDEGNVTDTDYILNENPISLLAFGLEPRFYEFTESIIEVKITISIKSERTFSTELDTSFSLKNTTSLDFKYRTPWWSSLLFGKASANVKSTTTTAFATSFNAKYQNKYTYSAQGTSLLRTTIKPVPAPPRTIPKIRVQPQTSGSG